MRRRSGLRRGDIERGADLSAPNVGVKGVDVFILGDGDGLEHGLGEIGECTGDFGLNLALSDSAKEPRHGNAEIASGQQFYRKETRNVLTDLLGGEGFGFLLGMEVTEMQVAGAARSAALAAIGKGEGAQTGTVLFAGGRKMANLIGIGGRRADFFLRGRRAAFCLGGRKTDFFICGRKTANGAVSGHGKSPERLDLSCKGSLAEGEAHYFTGLMYQSSDGTVNRNLEGKTATVGRPDGRAKKG